MVWGTTKTALAGRSGVLLGRVLEEKNQGNTHTHGFIRLAYMIGGWATQQWPSAHWRARKPSSCSVQEAGNLQQRDK
jgi:hypothetical protein